MRSIRLGATGPEVSALGFGTAAISGDYGPSDREQGIAAMEAALDAGVTLIDGGDFYGHGLGELLTAEVLRRRRREDVVISIKFGGQRDPAGNWLGHDMRPVALKSAIGYTLTRLGTDYVDIYRPSRVDPNVPIEEVVGAVGDLIDAGYVRHVGLSEAGSETLRRAHAVRAIVDVQHEYSLLSRGVERALLPAARELGVAITAYGVLSRGLLSGGWTLDRQVQAGDLRARAPRFQPENLERNLVLVEALREIAAAHNATPTQIAIAWVASRGSDVVPLVGGRRPEQVREALGAFELDLSTDDQAAIEAAVPAGTVAGDRYPAAILAGLDSERG
jgi:aryl-alcohol dehydrogenase-like predicted oxidoreductase